MFIINDHYDEVCFKIRDECRHCEAGINRVRRDTRANYEGEVLGVNGRTLDEAVERGRQ